MHSEQEGASSSEESKRESSIQIQADEKIDYPDEEVKSVWTDAVSLVDMFDGLLTINNLTKEFTPSLKKLRDLMPSDDPDPQADTQLSSSPSDDTARNIVKACEEVFVSLPSHEKPENLSQELDPIHYDLLTQIPTLLSHCFKHSQDSEHYT